MLDVLGLIAVVLTAGAVWLWLWRHQPPVAVSPETDFERQLRLTMEGMNRVGLAFGQALVPAMQRATEQFAALGRALLEADAQSAPGGAVSECANCGEPGHPGHHWMPDLSMYVCTRRADMDEDAPPPTQEDPRG